MSSSTNISIDTTNLVQRLQSAEKSIAFIQREHATTLSNLHDEISKWQQKCSDLTFQLVIGGGTIVQSNNEEKLKLSVEQLEKELKKCNDTIKQLNSSLEEKDRIITNYEAKQLISERKHELELKTINEKHRQLKMEFEQRSTFIAQLTSQLHRERQQTNTRRRPLQTILPDKPKSINSSDEFSSTSSSDRRSTLVSRRSSHDEDSNRVSFAGRRPPTPPQQLKPISSKTIDLNEEPSLLKRSVTSVHSQLENADSTAKVLPTRPAFKIATVLPPIVTRKAPLKPLTSKVPQQGEV